MEPREVAQALFDKVMDYCENERRSSIAYEHQLECVSRYGPDELLEFVNSHLTGEDKDIKEAIQNADQNFLNKVKKEYEELWNLGISTQLYEFLGDTLEALYENIVQNDLISDSCKVRRLKAYEEVLEKFVDSIKHAIQDKKPLTGYDLYDWFKKMGDAVFGVKNHDYYEEVSYYTGFYDMLSDTSKLETLFILLDYIDNVLYYIEHELRELEALTNES